MRWKSVSRYGYCRRGQLRKGTCRRQLSNTSGEKRRTQRTGFRTVAYGTREGDLLSLPNISMAADVHPGDKLLTSGLGGRFPPGFPVGEIRSVEPAASGMFLEGRARPAADLDRSDNVLLLHDLAEPVGPPQPVTPAGPPADLAPAPGSSAAAPSPAAAPPTPASTNPPVQP